MVMQQWMDSEATSSRLMEIKIMSSQAPLLVAAKPPY
jgi:hypothetical protein